MEQMGMGYEEMEKIGIMCPVLSVEADYLSMVHFGSVVTVNAYIKEYKGIKMTIVYEVVDSKTEMVHCRGLTKHYFINEAGKPVSLKQSCLEFHDMFAKGLCDYKNQQ